MGVFIQISLDNPPLEPDVARRLVRVCPVDIFRLGGDTLVIDLEQEDECTLCELCLEVAPEGRLRILKTYSGETLVSRGQQAE